MEWQADWEEDRLDWLEKVQELYPGPTPPDWIVEPAMEYDRLRIEERRQEARDLRDRWVDKPADPEPVPVVQPEPGPRPSPAPDPEPVVLDPVHIPYCVNPHNLYTVAQNNSANIQHMALCRQAIGHYDRTLKVALGWAERAANAATESWAREYGDNSRRSFNGLREHEQRILESCSMRVCPRR